MILYQIQLYICSSNILGSNQKIVNPGMASSDLLNGLNTAVPISIPFSVNTDNYIGNVSM